MILKRFPNPPYITISTKDCRIRIVMCTELKSLILKPAETANNVTRAFDWSTGDVRAVSRIEAVKSRTFQTVNNESEVLKVVKATIPTFNWLGKQTSRFDGSTFASCQNLTTSRFGLRDFKILKVLGL